MILFLFLISVGVLEFILRHEGKKQPDSAGDKPETVPAPPVTNDLLSLMRAVQGESQHAAEEVVPEPKTGDAVIRQ